MRKRNLCIKKITLTTVAILVVGFIYRNSKDALFGTKLSVSIARDGSTITNTKLPVTGFAPKVKAVTINKHPVPIDTDGHFQDTVILSPGYNIVEIATTNSFNKTTVRTYHLVGAPPNDTVALNQTQPIQN